jgi:hypothetical protein
MFSHGVIAGLLFAVVGRMVYERTHTRRLAASARCRSTGAAVRRFGVRDRRPRLDGHARLQRLPCRTHDSDLLLDWIMPALQSPAFALTLTKGHP